MSEEFTISDISKELGKSGLMIKPNAAKYIINSSVKTEEVLNSILQSENSTIDIDTVKNVIEDIQESTQNDTNNDELEQSIDSENNISKNSSQEKNTENISKTNINEDDSKTQTKNNQSIESNRKSRQKEFNEEKEKIENEDNIDSEFINPKQALQQLEKSITKTDEIEDKGDRKDLLSKRYPEWYETMFDRKLPDSQKRVNATEGYTVNGDITGESRGTGDFEDFRQIFKDRHERLTKILSNRAGGVYRVSDINAQTHGGKNIIVTGLVWDTFVSNNGNYFVELEDPKTNETLRTVFTDEDMKETFEQIVSDEVIAICGQLSDDGGIVFGNSEIKQGKPPIMFPDIPRRHKHNGPDETIHAALISDIHVGADEFFPEYWNQFVDWVRETPTVEYVIVAGDLVEGIGVFPDQDEELTIVDIYDQYAMTGKMFEQLPDDVQIITSVGNHDTVRLAEPQPTLAEEFTKYFPDNVDFVGNPVNLNIDGSNILVYHGMSIHALAESVPGIDSNIPTEAMKLMLQKRHVAPIYGKNVRLAGEEKDYLVIDTIPDLLHCGHVHKYDQDKYKGVQMVNTATWQGQTSFQKSKGIEPDVGYWATVNLSNMSIKKYSVDN